MTRFLLDTSVWLNRALIPGVLPTRIRRLIHGEVCGLCSVSFLEAALLHRKGRLGALRGSLQELLARATGEDVQPLELTADVAALTNEFPEEFQGDPFDRTIAATARLHRLTLITSDVKIRDAHFCEVEFFPFKPLRLES